MNRDFADQRPDDDRLESRLKTYELAARMQLAAPEALDISDEPEHILRLYGVGPSRSGLSGRHQCP